MSKTYLAMLTASAVTVAVPAHAKDCGEAMPAFQAAIKANTAEAMSAFIAENPGCFTGPATAKLEALRGADASDTTWIPLEKLLGGEVAGGETS